MTRSVKTTAQDLNIVPRALTEFVELEAQRDADAVAALLDRLGFEQRAAGQPTMLFSRSFLLSLGLAMRLYRWESQQISIHLDAGFPSGAQVLQWIVEAALDPKQRSQLELITSWLPSLVRLCAIRLAWDAATLLATEVVLGDVSDEEGFLDAVAAFVWENRHVRRNG